MPGKFAVEDNAGREAVLRWLEANDEWQIQNRYMQTEPMAELLAPISEPKPPRISTVAA